MAAQPDFVLQGNAVIDEDQFQEQAEGLQFEMQGDSEAIGEAQDMNEERNESLGLISRKLVSLLALFGKIAVVLGAILAVATVLANVFDISFEDVRNGIVQVIRALIDTVKDMIPGVGGGNGGGTPTPQTGPQQVAEGLVSGLGVPRGLLSGLMQKLNVGQNSEGELSVQVMTSRDQMTGDSTQRDQVNNEQLDNLQNWGE